MTIIEVADLTADFRARRAEQSYGHEEKKRGAIFTKQSVVDFMLDLMGYTPDRPLASLRLLEPSFGGGRFVLSAVDRLLESWRRSKDPDVAALFSAIRAVELDSDTFQDFKTHLRSVLVSNGIVGDDADALVRTWLVHDDYLLSDLDASFDFIIGNPPYVRQELVESDLLALYRSTFKTMVGRADLYVPFIERSLDLLAPAGQLSFICADAWVKNDYGRGLRAKIGSDFHLRYYVDMYGVDAFEVSVGAYPSITVIERAEQSSTRIAKATTADVAHLHGLREELLAGNEPEPGSAVKVVPNAVPADRPWLLSTSAQLEVIRHLEERFPTLEEAGCRIGIGVATGADKVFIAKFDSLDVEESRKLPLAMNKDVFTGDLVWGGKGVVNPWGDDGKLVDLAQFPRLAAYMEPFREQLEKRHTAKRDTARLWYKTIDRIWPELTWQEKLLIPDIKGNGDAITYDPGTLYPHHNLYFITSTTWNLRALQALLRSGIAHMFVEAYSVKIGGGYLRFQAQNLRRIRVPNWESISQVDRDAMVEAGESGAKLGVGLLARIYNVDESDLSQLI